LREEKSIWHFDGTKTSNRIPEVNYSNLNAFLADFGVEMT
jgi:hypothetical protein